MNNTPTEQAPRGPVPEAVVALLAAAGLQAKQVARCPEPDCPICARRSRAAA